MEPFTPPEQRAFAAAKIKRSTSLPRMSHGRRPRMHVEAVSEGEGSQLTPTLTTPGPKMNPPSLQTSPPEGTSTKPRRRGRSRSLARGRGSRDFKGKAEATQSPVPTNAVPSTNELSPDEGPVSSTQPTGFTSSPLVSQISAHFALLQPHRLLASPEPGMSYPGTSSPTSMPPTLKDIQREAAQRGRFRSDSAAARLMALQQLAGSEAYDPLTVSPPITPPPLPEKVFRNNTVGGSEGERIAARKTMLRLLNGSEQTRGGEDPQPASHTRRKRRRKLSTVVDDREPPSVASPTTPVFPTTSLPRSTQEPTRDESDTLAPPSPAPNPRSPGVERSREDALAKPIGESPSTTTYDYETHLERRGVVVEDDDDSVDHDHDQASPILRSTYNGRSDPPPRVASPRPPSSASLESAGDGVPAYLSDSSQEQQEVFPTSPFATPLREREESESESEDSHTESEPTRRSPWSDAFDRKISWAADVVPVRIPIRDDDDADDIHGPRNRSPLTPHRSDPEECDGDGVEDSLPRASINSKSIVVDIETSPEAPNPSQILPSPSSVSIGKRPRNDSIQERGNNTNSGTLRSNGTRSRNNSTRDRATNTDSSTSRESGANLTGASKTDKDHPSYFPSSPNAVSPVPPGSSETLQKYSGDVKLSPFTPGVKRLEEVRRSDLSLNTSSPDIAYYPTPDEFSALSSGSVSSRTPRASPEYTSTTLSSPSTSTSLSDPTTPATPNNSGWLGGKLPLPHNREGVKTWLRNKGLFLSQSSQASLPSLQQPVSASVVTSQSGSTDSSRRLSDLFNGRKESELMTEWEVMSRTPTTTSESATQGGESHDDPEIETPEDPSAGSSKPETPALDTPFGESRVKTLNGDTAVTYPTQSASPVPDPTTSSATPDPTSSLDDYASPEYLEHVNARGGGEMPMHDAASEGHANNLRLLQGHGADVGSRNKYGETPLHQASWSGKLDAGHRLLDLGADINARNEDDWTPLFHAIFHGRVEFAQMLLERGAAIEARSVFGSTALHAAVRRGEVQAVRLLLEHGADVNARDRRGRTPYQWKSTLGQEMVELLAEYGAEFGNISMRSRPASPSSPNDSSLIISHSHSTETPF